MGKPDIVPGDANFNQQSLNNRPFGHEGGSMKSRTALSAMLVATAFAATSSVSLAQSNPVTINEVISLTPKVGMTAKFEKGIKDINAYVQSHGLKTGTAAFEVLYGPQMGTIVILRPFPWEEGDNPPSYAAGVQPLVEKGVNPYLSSLQITLNQAIPNLGNPGKGGAAPQKYYEVITLRVRPARMTDFLSAVAQISAAETKENPSSNEVIFYRMVSGGDANEIVVAIGHPSFADIGRPGKSITEVLRQAYGEEAVSSVMNALYGAIEHEETTIVRYRPDLSATPGGS